MKIEKAYEILGIPLNTKDEETIRLTYRNLAKQYHPDANPNNEETMKEINLAYDTIQKYIKEPNNQVSPPTKTAEDINNMMRTYTNNGFGNNDKIKELTQIINLHNEPRIAVEDPNIQKIYNNAYYKIQSTLNTIKQYLSTNPFIPSDITTSYQNTINKILEKFQKDFITTYIQTHHLTKEEQNDIKRIFEREPSIIELPNTLNEMLQKLQKEAKDFEISQAQYRIKTCINSFINNPNYKIIGTSITTLMNNYCNELKEGKITPDEKTINKAIEEIQKITQQGLESCEKLPEIKHQWIQDLMMEYGSQLKSKQLKIKWNNMIIAINNCINPFHLEQIIQQQKDSLNMAIMEESQRGWKSIFKR